MSDTVTCPSCQRTLRVPESLLGQLVKCPTCQQTFTASLSAIRYGLTLFNDFTFQLKNPADGDEIEQDDNRTVLLGTLKYERIDKPGVFHTEWLEPEQKPAAKATEPKTPPPHHAGE